MTGLLETSIFIAREQQRPIQDVPETAAVSVMTLAELRLGVLLAKPALRAQRQRTLAQVEATFDVLPVDDEVAAHFAGLAADFRRRGKRINVIDGLIAATALRNDLPLYTQDRDFLDMRGLRTVLV